MKTNEQDLKILEKVYKISDDDAYTNEVMKAKNIEFVIEDTLCVESKLRPILAYKNKDGVLENFYQNLTINRNEFEIKKFRYNLDYSFQVLFEHRTNIYIAEFKFLYDKIDSQNVELIYIKTKN